MQIAPVQLLCQPQQARKGLSVLRDLSLSLLRGNNSLHAICPSEEYVASPALNTHPESSHPPPSSCTMVLLKPSTDYGGQPVAMDELQLAVRTGKDIAPGPEPYGESNQVCELATPCIAEGLLLESEGMQGSPVHNPATVDINISLPLEIVQRICWGYLRR